MRLPARCLVLIVTATAAAAAAPPLQAQNREEPRTISVTGQGEVRIKPDRARVQIGVEARHRDLDTARNQVNKVVAAFLEFSRNLDTPPERVKSTGVTVRPEYDWDSQSRERKFTGYFVARQIEVNLTELSKLGQLIEGALGIGVNHVSDPQLLATDRARHYREALARAAQDARANAEILAKSLNTKVGPARSINATQGGYVPPPRPTLARMESAAAPSGADTYAAGEITFSATVNAQFDLIVE